jgi:hypothetical protein
VRRCCNPDHLEPVTPADHHPNLLKTHCKNGHPFDEANTYVSPEGHRHCRACRREVRKNYPSYDYRGRR